MEQPTMGAMQMSFDDKQKVSATSSTIKMSARDVKVFYGDTEALHGINMDLYENEVVAFIGPSGCGK